MGKYKLAANAICDKGLLNYQMGGVIVLWTDINIYNFKRDPIANVRIDFVDKEVMKNYFWLLKDILTQDMHD